jgi:RNA polymerase sigma factor (sigma-70 family)
MERLCQRLKQVLMSYVSIDKVLSDYECFLNFKKGDENALAYLYKHFHKSLLFHGLKIVRDPFEVNSVIQEAFLKAWQLRGRLTSLPHTYRFIRLNVTWGCYSYYRRVGVRQAQQVILTDNIDLFGFSHSAPGLENEDLSNVDEERVQAIYKVIPYLPANQQTILTLYFKYGLSYKQIAKRFATSNQAISQELHKGLEHLKTVIHAKKKLDTPAKPNENQMLPYAEVLDGELLQVFRLRYEMKLSFDAIAITMNLPQAYVQQQYVAAHVRLQQLTKKGK